jgi:hypothetical protein
VILSNHILGPAAERTLRSILGWPFSPGARSIEPPAPSDPDRSASVHADLPHGKSLRRRVCADLGRNCPAIPIKWLAGARLCKNLRLSRSRPPKARSCRRATIMRPSTSLLKPKGGARPKSSRQCRCSASSRSKRMRSISAAIAVGSRQRRTIRRSAAQLWCQDHRIPYQRSDRHDHNRSSQRQAVARASCAPRQRRTLAPSAPASQSIP